MLPAATIRAKGVLTLAEDENRESYDFHFSGKRRLELEPSVGELVSATSTCLVVIGVGLNEEEIIRDIRALEQPLPPSCVAAIPSVKRAMTRAMAKDLRFEIDDSVERGQRADIVSSHRRGVERIHSRRIGRVARRRFQRDESRSSPRREFLG